MFTRITSFFKKYRFLSLIALLSLASIAYLAIFYRHPPPTTPRQPNTTTSILPTIAAPAWPTNSVEFSFPDNLAFTVPESLDVYTIDLIPLTPDQVQQFATFLGFSSPSNISHNPVNGDIYYWNNETGGMSAHLNERKISYTLNTLPKISSAGFVTNRQKQDQTITDFLNTLNRIFSTNYATQNIIYYLAQDEENVVSSDENKANLAKINISPLINGLPLIDTVNYGLSSDITLTSDGKILSTNILITTNIKPVGKYPTKSFEQVRNSISEAKILHQDRLNYAGTDPLEGQVKVTKIQTAYLRSNSNILQPVFLINVVGQSSAKEDIVATYALEALLLPSTTPKP